MKIKFIMLISLSFLLSFGCGKMQKKNKTKENTKGVENVQNYSDPTETDYSNEAAYNDSLNTNDTTNSDLSGEIDYSNYQSDTTDETENALPEDIATTSNTDVSKSSATQSSTTSSSTDYSVFYIVGGSFKNLSKAQRLNKQFNKEGVKSYVGSPINGFNRIITGKYYQKKAALKDLTKLRKRYKKLRFWLLGGH